LVSQLPRHVWNPDSGSTAKGPSLHEEVLCDQPNGERLIAVVRQIDRSGQLPVFHLEREGVPDLLTATLKQLQPKDYSIIRKRVASHRLSDYEVDSREGK
jgi:hypothetical protein